MSHVCNGDVFWGFDVYWYLLYPKDKYLGLDVPHVCRGQNVLGVWCVAVCRLGDVSLESDMLQLCNLGDVAPLYLLAFIVTCCKET